MHLQIFTTGGTLDKIYFDALSEYQVGDPVVGSILTKMNASLAFEVQSLCKKDSLDLTDADRTTICNAVSNTHAKHILITHGTDGMVQTAKALQQHANIEGKTIVFTGAMQPAAFANTDAVFNIGLAVGAVQSNNTGIYICMSGQVFDASKVSKNREKGLFEAV